jgi:RNA polymerase sigma-70 factor (ECF subfamily)
LVLAARGGQTTEARAALCAAYWYPLYAFVRRKGHDADSAQDLVQGFFTRLLEKGDLAAVDRGKGKFRSFLMAACTHYLANQVHHARARKRGWGRVSISIDRATAAGRYSHELAHRLTAERLFERHWALTVIDHAVSELEAEMTAAGQSRQFAALRPALLGRALRTPYAEIARELGLSEAAARAAAHRLRGRYRTLLRAEVARTVNDPAQVDEEIGALLAALAS